MAVARAKGRLRGKQPKLTRAEAHLVELYRAGEHTIGELEELFPVTRSTILPSPSRARAGERSGGQHRAQRDDRSRRTYHARRLPRLDDRQHGRRDSTAFQDEGFAPDPGCRYEDSSVRRQTTQSYLDGSTARPATGRSISPGRRTVAQWLGAAVPEPLSPIATPRRLPGRQADRQSRQWGRSCRSSPSRGSRTRRPSARASSASGARSAMIPRSRSAAPRN